MSHTTLLHQILSLYSETTSVEPDKQNNTRDSVHFTQPFVGPWLRIPLVNSSSNIQFAANLDQFCEQRNKLKSHVLNRPGNLALSVTKTTKADFFYKGAGAWAWGTFKAVCPPPSDFCPLKFCPKTIEN